MKPCCTLTAQSAGVPFLNAYLDRDALATRGGRGGVNFAVAGSTALPVEVLAVNHHVLAPVTNTSLTTQLHWMSTYFNGKCRDHDQGIGQWHIQNLFFYL